MKRCNTDQLLEMEVTTGTVVVRQWEGVKDGERNGRKNRARQRPISGVRLACERIQHRRGVGGCVGRGDELVIAEFEDIRLVHNLTHLAQAFVVHKKEETILLDGAAPGYRQTGCG